MKAPKTIKSIKAANDGNTLLAACAILEHRPNMRNKARKEYQKHKDKYGSYVHNYYNKGFEEGYKYAIERLQRHSS
jgi:hypothetical protein